MYSEQLSKSNFIVTRHSLVKILLYLEILIYVGSIGQLQLNIVMELMTIILWFFLFYNEFTELKVSRYLVVFLILLFFLFPLKLVGVLLSTSLFVLSLKLIVLYIVFSKMIHISTKEFLRIINNSYLFVLLLSIPISQHLIPSLSGGWNNANDGLMFGLFYQLTAPDGSMANIDSYSGFIMITNILYNKTLKGKFFIFLSGMAMILSFTATPLVAVFMSWIVYRFVNKRFFVFLLIMSLIFTPFISYSIYKTFPQLELNLEFIKVPMNYFLSFALSSNVQIESPVIPFSVFMILITNGRSEIWFEQLNNVFSLEWWQILIAPLNFTSISVPISWGEYTVNPHNSFLILFFESPIIFFILIFYIIYIIYKYGKMNKRVIILLVFIATAATQNSQMLWIYNSIYFLTFLFFIYERKEHNV